jgi:hypothetical protein
MAKSSSVSEELSKSTEEVKKVALRKRPTREERKKILETGKQHIDDVLLDHENFQYRLCNEKVGLVEFREKLGYEIVKDADGNPIRKVASTSKGADATHAVLMRIPREEYEEIQSIKTEKTDAQIQSINPDSSKGQYGQGLKETKH